MVLPQEDGGGSGSDGSVNPPPGDKPCDALSPRAGVNEVFVGPTGLLARIVGAIDGAQTSLDVSMYIADQASILSALSKAAGRGVVVRMVLDGDRSENEGTFSSLKAAGVDIRTPQGTFEHYHVKTVIIDGQSAIVFSGNFNDYTMSTERNHGMVVTDPFDVADLESVFEADFAGGTVPTCTRLVVSPTNSRDRIEALLTGATNELLLQELSISDSSIRTLLANRAKGGLTIRVILANPAWISANTNTASILRAAGVEVRFLKTLDNHAKLIVADGARAYVGSHNLSWTSLEKNREVGVVTVDQASVTTLKAAFDADWAVSVE
ncbi:MAG: hypothetical protein KC416_06405 [Myxococcales bacterium]|nr:hypothetical protein [Myxococcales bacterium]